MSRYYPDGAATTEFAKAMQDLADALGATVTESRIRVYAKLLGDVPPEALYVAFRRAANERTYTTFPTVGELRRYVAPSEDDAGLLAWSRFDQAAREVGAWTSLDVEDWAAADALVTVFGSWPAYCDVDEGPALGSRRQEFLAAYRQARRTSQSAPLRVVETLRHLPGLCELDGPLADGAVVGRLMLSGDVVVERSDGRALAEGQDRLLGQGADAPAAQGAQEAARARGDR